MGERRARHDMQSIQEHRLIERVPVLHPSHIGDSTDGVGVMLVLPGDAHNGIIRITYEAYDYNLSPPHTTVVSYIESPGSLSQKDPLQGVAAAFTMAAVIDQAARMTKQEIIHKVLANKKSAPLFERLREWNLYQYSDSLGVPSPLPVQADIFSNKVYYSCWYPNTQIQKEFERFRVDEASQKLVDTFPTPIRLLQHKLVKTMRRHQSPTTV